MKNFIENGKLDLNFNLNDVVNVFVSKYEKKLEGEKKGLEEEIGRCNKEMEDVKKGLLSKYNFKIKEIFKKKFNFENENELFKCEFEEGGFSKELNEVRGELSLIKKNNNGYGGVLNFYESVKVSDVDKESVRMWEEKINELRMELGKVLVEIGRISSKEREIRGLISERKLVEEGYVGLIEDEEIKKLIGMG